MGVEIPLVWHCTVCNKITHTSKVGAKAEKKIEKKKYCNQCRKREIAKTKVPKGKK